MATELLMRRRLGSLWPADAASEEALQGIKPGEDIRVTLTKPRNVKFHRLFFGLLNLVQPNTDYTPDQFLTVVKIGVGHVDPIILPDGTTAWHPRSISFARMDDVAFRAFFNAALDFIVRRVLPGTSKAELEREVFEFIGMPLEDAA